MTFERVYEKDNGNGANYDSQFAPNGNFIAWPEPSVEAPQKLGPAALDRATLPDELIAELRLTDTSVTKPLF